MENVVIARLKGSMSQVRSLSWYMLASLLPSVVSVAFNPFLAKNLSALDYSIIGYFTSFISLFTPILNFSVVSFYVRKYFKIPEEHRQGVCDVVVTALLAWGLISQILVLVGLYYYHSLNQVEFPFFPFAFIVVAQTFFNNFTLVYQVNCRMLRKARSYFWIAFLGTMITLFLSILLVIVIKGGAVGRLSSGLISAVIVGLFAIIKTLRRPRLDRKILKEALSFGWPISLSSIVEYFMEGVAMALIAGIGDTDNMGLFVVGATLGGYLAVFYGALIQTFEPDIYKAVADYDYKRILKIVSGILLILVAIVFAFWILAKPVTYILTYGKYTDAYYFARIISLSVLTSFLMSITKMIMNAFGFTKATLLNQILSAASAYICYYFLVAHFQFTGAAYGRVLAPSFVFIFGFIQLLLLTPRIKRMRINENK